MNPSFVSSVLFGLSPSEKSRLGPGPSTLDPRPPDPAPPALAAACAPPARSVSNEHEGPPRSNIIDIVCRGRDEFRVPGAVDP